MIKAIVFDFSRVLLHFKDAGKTGEMNGFHYQNKNRPGYSILKYFQLNTELLQKAESLKGRLKLYVFTTGSIQNEPELIVYLDPVFENIFTVADIGFLKSDPKAYIELSKKIGVQPKEILFIDDTKENIEAAKKAGLNTIHFKSTDQALKEISKMGPDMRE